MLPRAQPGAARHFSSHTYKYTEDAHVFSHSLQLVKGARKGRKKTTEKKKKEGKGFARCSSSSLN